MWFKTYIPSSCWTFSHNLRNRAYHVQSYSIPTKGVSSDVIMSVMASQITSVLSVCSTVCPGADQRKYQSSVSLAFVRRSHRWQVDSLLKGPVTRKMFPFDDVIIIHEHVMASKRIICHIIEDGNTHPWSDRLLVYFTCFLKYLHYISCVSIFHDYFLLFCLIRVSKEHPKDLQSFQSEFWIIDTESSVCFPTVLYHT